jgi:periplasmic protein CpxP/Spy
MKKLLLSTLITFSLAAGSLSFAQPPAGSRPMGSGMKAGPKMEKKAQLSPEERAQKMTDKMAEELQLSAAQKEKIYQINLSAAQKNEVQLQQMEAAKAEMRTIQQSRIVEIEKLLTEEQIAILKQQREERQADMQQKREQMREKYQERTREK